MKNWINKRTGWTMALVFAVLLVGIGCGSKKGEQLGKAVPKGQPVVKLADILKTPQEFNGKEIVMKGIISGQCPSFCEFFYKEGARKVTIFPQGFKFPKLPVGRNVMVYALVTAGEESVVFSALGIELV